MGLISETNGKYHADPLFAQLGILKIGDLYRQQLRIHAWQFMKGFLPASQAVILSKIRDIHGHNTRSARRDLFVSTSDQRSIGYRIPKEWQSIPEDLKKLGSLTGLKKKSKQGFINKYKSFQCEISDCYICRNT